MELTYPAGYSWGRCRPGSARDRRSAISVSLGAPRRSTVGRVGHARHAASTTPSRDALRLYRWSVFPTDLRTAVPLRHR